MRGKIDLGNAMETNDRSHASTKPAPGKSGMPPRNRNLRVTYYKRALTAGHICKNYGNSLFISARQALTFLRE